VIRDEREGGGPVPDQRLDEALAETVLAVAGGLDLEATLTRIVAGAVTLAGARYGALGVVGADGTLREFVHTGMSPAQVAAIGDLPRGRGLLGMLLVDDPRPLRVAQIDQDDHAAGFPPGHPPMGAFLGVPVPVRDRTFGNLYLTKDVGEPPFTAEDQRVVEVLAAAAGVAVGNARLYETARLRASWLSASSEISTAVLSGEPADRVLELITGKALEVSGADVVMLALPAGDALRYQHVAGVAAEDYRGLLVPADYLAGEVARTGRAVVVEQIDGPAGAAGAAPGSAGASMLMPLNAGGRTTGVLVFGSRRGGRRFSEDELATAQAFADQAALALVMGRASDERQRLAVLEDRDRIARDLHDLVIQRLFATGLSLQALSRRPELPPVVQERLARAVGDLDETIVEVRTTIFALQESRRDQPSGLRGRVLRECASAGESLGFEPTVTFGGAVDSLVADAVADDVLAVIREALSNAARHARASVVQVSVAVDGGDVVVSVSDDGRGMGPTRRRSGLGNLGVRAQRAGGAMAMEPLHPDGTGTRLTWRAPLGAPAARGEVAAPG